MSELQYHRPKTLKEALELLDQGMPLAGGTALVPQLKGTQTVIDLQDLGLDGVKKTKTALQAGAAVKLQTLLTSSIPRALAAACQLEASLNLRNMATLGGTIMSADGRSPLLTTLLALDAEVQLEPSSESLPLDQMLSRRGDAGFRSLITSIRMPLPLHLAYDQVARAPLDRPIVCAAVGRSEGKGNEGQVHIALGGFGPRPARLMEAEEAFMKTGEVSATCALAGKAYAEADDQWASGEYRSHVAEVLVRRLLVEVMA